MLSIRQIMLKAKKYNKLLLMGAISAMTLGLAGCTSYALSTIKPINVSHVNLTKVLNSKYAFSDTDLANIVKHDSTGFGNTLTDRDGSPNLVTFQHGRLGFGRHSLKLCNFAFNGATDKRNNYNPSDHDLLTEPSLHYRINSKHEFTISQPLNSVGNLADIKYKLVSASNNYGDNTYSFVPVKINKNSDNHYHRASKHEKSIYKMKLTTDGKIQK